MTKEEKFDLAMKAEVEYMHQEYAAVARGDYAGAERAHKMRWRVMDKAVRFLEEDQ